MSDRRIILDKEIKGRILDLGGGGEGIIGRLYGAQVVAVDHCQEELDEAPQGFQKLLMDATKLEFLDGSFDNVTLFYSLMYMRCEEQRQALREAARVLRDGGNLYLWDTDVPSVYPEPFCTELDIVLPGERIHTTYGIVKQDTQNSDTIQAMCLAAGLTPVSSHKEAGHFFLCFRKES